ncbi:MAG: DUF1326 domain-containing protein [Acidiferrobacterales bacterium]
MPDQWMIRTNSYGNCNCATNCGCQFNLPSTHGFCQFVEGGHIEEGYFNDTSLNGLNWAFVMIWPGEIAEGNGKQLVIIDERADSDQRDALSKIVRGEVGEPGSNHFSVFGSTCSEVLDNLYLPIEYEIDIEARTAHLNIPGLVDTVGSPLINEFDGEEFHIGIARTAGSFEFTFAELGQGTANVTGSMAMDLDSTYAQFCTLHYDQDGLVKAA